MLQRPIDAFWKTYRIIAASNGAIPVRRAAVRLLSNTADSMPRIPDEIDPQTRQISVGYHRELIGKKRRINDEQIGVMQRVGGAAAFQPVH
jgi:hypothetical protein